MYGPGFQSPGPHNPRRVSSLWDQDCINGTLGRIFWRVLDTVDYRVMQARLWAIDVACGPFPDCETPD
jgi:hypothetical protein